MYHGDNWRSVAQSKQVLGSRPFCAEFARSPYGCAGSVWVLWLPPTLQKHTTKGLNLLEERNF